MFSVIIPAYNAAGHIQNAIRSVLAQTVEDFEIIVVDDGSGDDTAAVVAAVPDPRIYCIRKENGGVSSARNRGIQAAKGEYICFLDADDLWKPHHLEVVSGLVDKYPEAGVYLTGYEILLCDGQTKTRHCPCASPDLFSSNVFGQIWEHGYFIHTNSIVCKTSALEKVGMFELGVKNGEDDDLWYRLFAYCSAAISGEITTTYVRENSTATESRVFVEDWVFLKRVDGILASPEIPEPRKQSLRHLMEQRKLSTAREHILKGDKKIAWKIFRKVKVSLVRRKKWLGTLAALLIPYRLTKAAIDKRDEKYYQGK